jgi:hypothetical protein
MTETMIKAFLHSLNACADVSWSEATSRQRGNSALAFSRAANRLLAAALFGALAVVSSCCDSD